MKVRRKIIKIDDEVCNGCGQCVPDCAEGSLQVINGRARVVADQLCDEEAVHEFLAGTEQAASKPAAPHGSGCPSARLQSFAPMTPCQAANAPSAQNGCAGSALTHWPVQIRLIPATAPFLERCR